MGFRFRRSLKILPGIRLNLSGSGPSVSVGGKGFHYTVGSEGTRVTAGIPGTGLSWSKYTPYAQKSLVKPRLIDSSSHIRPNESMLTPIDSASPAEIDSLSTCELAPILNGAYRKSRLALPILLMSVLLFVTALLQANQLWMSLSAFYATIFIPAAIFLDRYRRSVKVIYETEGAIGQIAKAIADSFGDLAACKAIWEVQAEGATNDWKRNAGATNLNRRKDIKLQFDKPNCVRGKSLFPVLNLGSNEVYLLPDAVLTEAGGSIAALNYHELKVLNSRVKFIEEDSVPSDTPIIGQTWRYLNKKGGPDLRFNNNRQLPICSYGELTLRS
ncbi:MAG: DUF4236 domain-containing protein, partial [Proteobacteria bacterium]|nr:DUF4236 domain-containing protein [Pseudomonadota bacterium]